MPQYAPRSARRHVRAGEFLTIPICPSLRGWPAPGTAALSGFPPTARDVAGSRSRPSQDLPACLAAGIWFAGRAGQARTADSNGGNRRLASAIDSSAGRSHISPRLGICHAWKADDRRAISVQLATVKRGQSRVLRVSEVGCSAASSAVICPIPKLIVCGSGNREQPVPCQNSFIAADLAFRARYAALRYSLIRPPRTCLRSILAVMSRTWPGWRRGGSCCRPWCGRWPL